MSMGKVRATKSDDPNLIPRTCGRKIKTNP